VEHRVAGKRWRVPRTKLPPLPTSPGAARRFVADVLLDVGFGNSCVEQAVLVASEVVTEAMERAGADIEFVVIADPPMVRLEVHEDGWARLPRHTDPDGSYRLRLIDALCEGWGVEERDNRYTWFEVR
jgi:hypothetical protein